MFTRTFQSPACARVFALPHSVLIAAASLFVFAHTQSHAQEAKSAFSAYKKFDDPGVSDWKASNDKVRTLGGWRTYLKEAYENPEAPVTDAPVSDAQVPASAARPSDVGKNASPPEPSHSHHHGGEK